MESLTAVLVGLGVGGVLGLLGAGGSLLTVPAMILLLGLSAGEATGTSLVAVAMMASAGAVVHGRAGRCACREGAVFGVAGAVTAAAAGLAASAVPDDVLTVAFVALLVTTAVWLVRRDEDASATERRPPDALATAAAGGGVGALTGLLGVGGGFLIVPALLRTRGMPMRLAIGTSQLVILISALGGITGRLAGHTVRWDVGLLFGLGGVVGSALGSRAADAVPAERLRTAFAVVAVLVATVLLWRLV